MSWLHHCICITLPNVVAIGQQLPRYGDFLVFKMAAFRQLGLVVIARVWTIHKKYFVVFIVV